MIFLKFNQKKMKLPIIYMTIILNINKRISKLFYFSFTEYYGSYYMNLTLGNLHRTQLKSIDLELQITISDNIFYKPFNSSISKKILNFFKCQKNRFLWIYLF